MVCYNVTIQPNYTWAQVKIPYNFYTVRSYAHMVRLHLLTDRAAKVLAIDMLQSLFSLFGPYWLTARYYVLINLTNYILVDG